MWGGGSSTNPPFRGDWPGTHTPPPSPLLDLWFGRDVTCIAHLIFYRLVKQLYLPATLCRESKKPTDQESLKYLTLTLFSSLRRWYMHIHPGTPLYLSGSGMIMSFIRVTDGISPHLPLCQAQCNHCLWTRWRGAGRAGCFSPWTVMRAETPSQHISQHTNRSSASWRGIVSFLWNFLF